MTLRYIKIIMFRLNVKYTSVSSVYTKLWFTYFYQKWSTEERLFLHISDLEDMLFY